MSQSSMAPLARQSSAHTHSSRSTVDSAPDIGTVLDLLDDEDCRCILQATGTEPLSATELSEHCDIPLSTVYRKVERLELAALLEERVRLGLSGNHASEYRRRIDAIEVRVDSVDGFCLRYGARDDRREERQGR
jgi:predicted transcriptional regulator